MYTALFWLSFFSQNLDGRLSRFPWLVSRKNSAVIESPESFGQ